MTHDTPVCSSLSLPPSTVYIPFFLDGATRYTSACLDERRLYALNIVINVQLQLQHCAWCIALIDVNIGRPNAHVARELLQ